VDDLARKIMERVLEEGPITFEAFMEMALYWPGLGYYAREDAEIGRAGDFYTSPHLHRAFGAMLGRQVEEMWQTMGRPGLFQVVEAGGGRGWLARDMLDYLRDREIFGSLRYALVEMNPHLARRQRELLSQYGDRLRWASSFGELGEIRGCVITNELLDALPVHLVEMHETLMEIYVGARDGKFVETAGPPSSAAIPSYFEEFGVRLSPGYRTEANLRMRGWLREVSSALKEGFVLTVDYGYPAWDYYGEDRTRGTLLCYHRHRSGENPYENVGRQDITAHVNFSALMKWGQEAGLRPLGYCRQGVYLVSMGIVQYMAGLGSDGWQFEAAKIKGLILPGTMGESHKVMLQYKGEGSPAPRGFAMKNELWKLEGSQPFDAP
jgi:SAM-dependent MidA family methyltransferase